MSHERFAAFVFILLFISQFVERFSFFDGQSASSGKNSNLLSLGVIMSILESLIKMPGFLPVIGTLGGALITGLIAYGMNRTNKQSEERKHHRELIFKTAFDSWKQHTDIAIAKMKVGHATKTMPLDSHIISLMAFSESFSDKIITKNSILKELEKIDEINDAVEKYHIDRHNDRKNNTETNQNG